MKVLVVLAHPEPKSFNAAMFRAAVETLQSAGHHVETSDLYRMSFDPVSSRRNFVTEHDPDYLKLQLEESAAAKNGTFAPDLDAEMSKVAAADLLILQFPMWWFGLPAILKGWVDRVFAMGMFYGGGRVYDTGVLRGRRALLSLTSGSPADAFTPQGIHGDIGGVLRPIHRGILQFVGYDVLAPQVNCGPVRVPPEVRAQWLDAWRKRLRAIEAETPIDVGRY